MRFAALAGFPLVETQRNQLSSANMKYRIFHAAIFSNKFQISANGGAQPRWNKNGKEIFYVSLDSKMMAARLKLSPDGQSLETGTPTALFPVRIAGGPLPGVNNKQQYAVSSDGQRFLVNLVADEPAVSPITLIYNWKPKP